MNRMSGIEGPGSVVHAFRHEVRIFSSCDEQTLDPGEESQTRSLCFLNPIW
jgi:hypothetical protein